MADSTVKIILTAVDKASATIKQTDKAIEGLGKTTKLGIGSFTELASGIAVAERVIRAAQQAIDQTVGVTVEYNKQIREMTQVTGLGAEEISRIVQVADDWGIEIGALRTSLGYMNKMGLTPSVDNLAKLADEYVNSTNKAEFAEKAAKLLGRGYQTLIPLLAKGGDALREQTGAVDENLIATDRSIRAAREYEVALDTWNDSVLGLKMSIGTGLLPSLTALINLMTSPSADKAAEFINALFPGGQFASDAWKARKALTDYGISLEIAAEAQTRYYSGAGMVSQIMQDEEEAVEAVALELFSANAAIDEHQRLLHFWANSTEEVGEAAEEAAPEVKSFLDGIDRDIASPIASFIKDIQWMMAGGGRIEEAFKTLQTLAPEMDPAAVQAIAQELLIAATDLEMTLDPTYVDEGARLLEDTLGKAAAAVAMNDIEGSQGIAGALERVTEVERKLVFRFVYLGKPPPGWSGGGWEQELSNPPKDIPKATGGPVTAASAYLVGERGPELFVPGTAGTIVPNNQLSTGGGGGISIGDIIINAGNADPNAIAAMVIQRIQAKMVAASRSGAYAVGR